MIQIIHNDFPIKFPKNPKEKLIKLFKLFWNPWGWFPVVPNEISKISQKNPKVKIYCLKSRWGEILDGVGGWGPNHGNYWGDH